MGEVFHRLYELNLSGNKLYEKIKPFLAIRLFEFLLPY